MRGVEVAMVETDDLDDLGERKEGMIVVGGWEGYMQARGSDHLRHLGHGVL